MTVHTGETEKLSHISFKFITKLIQDIYDYWFFFFKFKDPKLEYCEHPERSRF